MKSPVHSAQIGTLFTMAILLIFISGCRKKDVEVYPVPKINLMTLNFTQDYINPKLGAVVFASDSLGRVIADTLIKGNVQLNLLLRSGIKKPSRFTLTIATWEPSMHNFEIRMQSYLQVATSEWTLAGNRPDTLGHFTINLSGVPGGSLVIYANSGYSNLTTIYSNVNNLSYVSPDVLLVKTENGESQRYLWLTDVRPGHVYNLDMLDSQAPALETIMLAGIYYEARIWGYRESDPARVLPVMTNYALGNVPMENQIKVAVFPQYFQSYATEIKLVENWSAGMSFVNRINGQIPQSFSKLEASVGSFADHTKGRISFTPAGSYTTGSANWEFYGQNNQFFKWELLGTDTTSVFQLPDPSPLLKQTFPTLSLDSLYFHHLVLSDYLGISNYETLLQQVFDPAHPQSFNTLDVSSLVYGQSK